MNWANVRHSAITGEVDQRKLRLEVLDKHKPAAYLKLRQMEKALKARIGVDRLFQNRAGDISMLLAINGNGEQLAHTDYHLGDGYIICVFTKDTKESTRFWPMPISIRRALVKYFYQHPPPATISEYTKYIAKMFEVVMPRDQYGPGTIPR